jgi:hypothetical protein
MEADRLHATNMGGHSLTLDPIDGRIVAYDLVK